MGITFDSDALTLGILVNASDALGSPAAPLFPQLLLNYVCFFFHKSHQLGMIRETQKLLPWTFCHTLQHGVGEEWRGGGALEICMPPITYGALLCFITIRTRLLKL